MAGTPEKMLEHLLETRMDGRGVVGGKDLTTTPHADHFVDDFLLTYMVFMTTKDLVNQLSRQYPFSAIRHKLYRDIFPKRSTK